MAREPALTDTQLEELEGALEALTGGEGIPDGVDPEVAERLGEYAVVVEAARMHLLDEEVSAGLLDDVLAAAQAESTTEAEVPVDGPGVIRPAGTWGAWKASTLGRVVVPGLALAAAAALVLVFVRPSVRPAATETLARTDTPTAAPIDKSVARPQPVEAEPDHSDEEAPMVPAEAKMEEAPAPGAQPSPSPPRAGGGSKSAKTKAKAPTAAPTEPEPKDAPATGKDALWDRLKRGDAARRGGRCASATSVYKEILASEPDALVAMRAEAGLGLCLEAGGQTQEASSAFARARGLDPAAADAYVRGERNRMAPSKPDAPRKKKAARKSSSGYGDVPDAFKD